MNFYDLVIECRRRYGSLDNIPKREKAFLVEQFEIEFKKYLYLFFNDYQSQPYLKKFLLNTRSFAKIFKDTAFLYFICTELNVSCRFTDVPSLLEALIKRFGLKQYNYLSHSDLTKKVTDYLGVIYDENYGIRYVGFGLYSPKDYTLDDYDNGLILPKKEWAYAEYDAYTKELAAMQNYGLEGLVVFAPDEMGDGIGGDILSSDPITFKEKIIEVKSSHDYSMKISYNEYINAVKPLDGIDMDYYIHFYLFDGQNLSKLIKFKFYRDDNLFRNVADLSRGFFVPNIFRVENNRNALTFVNYELDTDIEDFAKRLKLKNPRITQ